ncbi:N-acetylglucosamine kinase [Devosia sediminis]|uniref:ATPase BadF/BadG/BcrA/BcrD type domain-containing protein n=1 Tax=Devosia sediminis TaxID=2798801 RepID=A0A934MPA3_9HYPH|nr:BadF/BadG/BcrA/BcrD ATPase family protein [Devosia sediminis]MBJ3783109.1 hypothetical protein [Devosia sediminis]
MTVIGIDIGQSGSRARRSGSSEDMTGPGYWSAPIPVLVRDLVQAIAPVDEPLRLGVGLTGYEPQSNQASAIGQALSEAGFRASVVIADDCLTAYLGALDCEPGGMVIAGTGSVALALDPGHAMARADGWGSELGDHGSGYWIGREAIRQGLRLHDAGLEDALVDSLVDHWGPLATIASTWRRDRPDIEAIAAFARPVITLAGEGNATATDIASRAARHLAESLAMTIQRAGLSERAVPYTGLGGIFAAGAAITTPFVEAMQTLMPAAHYRPPEADPLTGCITLAEIRPDPVMQPLYETFGD